MHVTLEEVSFADAPARALATAVVRGVAHDPATGDTIIPFSIAAPDVTIDPRAEYGVRVWIDRDSDGRSSRGDLYSDRRYLVLTGGFGPDLLITLAT